MRDRRHRLASIGHGAAPVAADQRAAGSKAGVEPPCQGHAAPDAGRRHGRAPGSGIEGHLVVRAFH
ncbi:MAG: hypothetical protein ABW023_14080 [Sphingomonas sp.]